MARYRFVDRWSVQAPIEQVFRHISDPSTYPQWWPVYPSVELSPGAEPARVGSQAKLTVASALGYRLRLELEVSESEPPRRIKTIARGNLEGTGLWELEQKGDTTTAVFTWEVETNHRLLNLLEPIAKRVFEWSHHDASAKGHRGLKRLLERRA